ncbi:MAG: hypothetical protein KTR31_37210 [Myxococcales bacterium]|nr:hypothetical protein [Myxococcales bacterium]
MATLDLANNVWTVVHPDGRTTTYGSVSGVSENATVPLYTEFGRVLQHLDNSGQPATAWSPDEAAYHPDFSTCGFSTIQIKRCNTAMWLPSVQEDPYGNQVVYDYGIAPAPTNAPTNADYWYEDGRARRLSEIRYGPSERERVVFGYEPHPFPTLSMSKGYPEFLTERLTTIDVQSDGASIGGYRLSYRNEGGSSYLETVDRTTPNLGATALQIRAYDYSFDEPTWDTAIDVTNAFSTAGWTAGWDRVIATPMNLNGDGRADLLWSRVDCSSPPTGLNCTVDHDAKVLSEGFGPGGLSLGAGFIDDPLADYIESQLASRITDDEFELERAWFFADFDGDGYQELVHEKEDPVSGDLLAFVARFDPYQKTYLDASFPLSDIDELTPADINGDGCVDLIRDPDPIRTGDEEWYRSTCRDPWIDGTPMSLDTERAGTEDAEDETGETLTLPQHQDASGLIYKFAEVNGDGMVDLVVSTFMRWRPVSGCTLPNCNWVPFSEDTDGDNQPDVMTAAFSRTYLGDGYGGFLDSGLEAGAPFLMELDHEDKERTLPTFWNVRRNLDGNSTMLVGSRRHDPTLGGLDVYASRFKGIELGFDLIDEQMSLLENNWTTSPTSGTWGWVGTYPAPGELDLGIEATSYGDICIEHHQQVVMADFDGDGFDDILEIFPEGNPDATGACASGFCVQLRRSSLDQSYGRLVEVRKEDLGAIELSWGHSAHPFHDNPELPTNVEVLERVDGPEGRVLLRYGHGAMGRKGFAGFGTVERDRQGIVDSFGFYLTPQLRGSPMWAARHRLNGSLERVDVWAYGRFDGSSLTLNYEEPTNPGHTARFNPAVRACVFEPESLSQATIEGLLDFCYSKGLSGLWDPALSTIFAASGHWRYPSYALPAGGFLPPSYVSDMLWNYDGIEVPLLNHEDAARPDVVGIDSDWTPLPNAQTAPWNADPAFVFPDLRWPTPSQVTVASSPPENAWVNARPLSADGNVTSAFVTEYDHDHATQKTVSTVELRDLYTPDDDRTTDLTFEAVAGTTLHRKKMQVKYEGLPGGTGAIWSTQSVKGWDATDPLRPTELWTSGTLGTTIKKHFMQFGSDGELTQSLLDFVSTPDRLTQLSTTEFCRDREVIDPAGERRTFVLDEWCRTTEETWRGATTSTTFTPLGFVATETLSTPPHPSGLTQPTVVHTYQYDHVNLVGSSRPSTAGGLIADTNFNDPKVKVRDSFGNLTLEYRDEFGRTTMTTECAALGNGFTCDPSQPARAQWQGYDTHGKQMATAPPFDPRTTDVVHATRVERDGYGREIVIQEPPSDASVSPTPLRSYVFYAPHREIREDPLGDRERHRWTTMEDTSYFNGALTRTEELDVYGNVVRELPVDGTEWLLTYDDWGRLEERRTAANASIVSDNGMIVQGPMVESYAYNDADERTELQRADGTTLRTSFDTMSRPVLEELLDSSGTVLDVLSTTAYTLDVNGHLVTRVTDRQGGWIETVTDGFGGTLRESTSTGTQTDTLQLAPATGAVGGRRVQTLTTDGSLSTTAWAVHDAVDDLVEETTPEAGTTTHTYDVSGQRIQSVDADGVTIGWGYAHDGSVLEETLGSWTMSTTTYDALGRVATQTTADGVQTLTYDDRGRITRRERGSGDVVEELTYDGISDRVLTRTLSPTSGPAGQSVWTHQYDAWGRKTSTSDPTGAVTQQYFDVLGRLRRNVDAEGDQAETRYDEVGRVVFADLPGRNTLSTTYADTGMSLTLVGSTAVDHLRKETVTDGEGHSTERWLDSANRVILELRADGTRTEFHFDGSRESSVREVDTASTVVLQTDHQYDADGRRIGTDGPYDPGATTVVIPNRTMGYTAAGRLAFSDEEGERTDRTWGATDGLPATETFLGLVKTTTHTLAPSGVGPLPHTEVLQPVGGGAARTTTSAYDSLGRLSSQVVAAGASTVTRTFTGRSAFDHPATVQGETDDGVRLDQVDTTFTYDAMGRVLTRALDINGVDEGTTTLTYYDNGVLEQQTGPSGKTVHFDYGGIFDHELDEVRQGVAGAAGGDLLFDVTLRDDAGRATVVDRPELGSTVELTFDAVGRVTQTEETLGSTVEKRWIPTYDSLGRVTQQSQLIGGSTTIDVYVYDGAGHLVEETVGLTGDTYTYTVDDAGRRSAIDQVVGGAPSTISVTYTTDGVVGTVDGNAVTYDDWLGTVTNHNGASFVRDASGRVATATTGGITTRYLRDGFGMPVAQEDATGDLRVTHWHPVNPGGRPVEETLPSGDSIVYVEGPSGIQRLTYDSFGTKLESRTLDVQPTGTPMAEDLTQWDAGNAFGMGTQSTPSAVADDGFGFAGMQVIAGTDTVHLARHRVYDAVSGHFLSPDPLGTHGDAHRTLYAMGNPLLYADPMGFKSTCTILSGSPPPTLNAEALEISASADDGWMDVNWTPDIRLDPVQNPWADTDFGSLLTAGPDLSTGGIPCHYGPMSCSPPGSDEGSTGSDLYARHYHVLFGTRNIELTIEQEIAQLSAQIRQNRRDGRSKARNARKTRRRQARVDRKEARKPGWTGRKRERIQERRARRNKRRAGNTDRWQLIGILLDEWVLEAKWQRRGVGFFGVETSPASTAQLLPSWVNVLIFQGGPHGMMAHHEVHPGRRLSPILAATGRYRTPEIELAKELEQLGDSLGIPIVPKVLQTRFFDRTAEGAARITQRYFEKNSCDTCLGILMGYSYGGATVMNILSKHKVKSWGVDAVIVVDGTYGANQNRLPHWDSETSEFLGLRSRNPWNLAEDASRALHFDGALNNPDVPVLNIIQTEMVQGIMSVGGPMEGARNEVLPRAMFREAERSGIVTGHPHYTIIELARPMIMNEVNRLINDSGPPPPSSF